EGIDFLPLTVDYQEKFYAAGRIPGGYFKREGRPTEKETLVSRLIDRPVRPLFAEGWRNETQVIVTTLSHDLENDPDILALIEAIIKLAEKAAKEPRELQVADTSALEKEMLALVEADLRAAYAIPNKMERHEAADAAKAKVAAHFCPEGVETPPYSRQQVADV